MTVLHEPTRGGVALRGASIVVPQQCPRSLVGAVGPAPPHPLLVGGAHPLPIQAHTQVAGRAGTYSAVVARLPGPGRTPTTTDLLAHS